VPIEARQRLQSNVVGSQPSSLRFAEQYSQRFIGDEGGIDIPASRSMPNESNVLLARNQGVETGREREMTT
jgi:hypothetical protein